LIDIHFHCLPGIDDGPSTWDEAVALCRAAFNRGVDQIVATPHVLRDPWLNMDAAKRRQLLDELNRRLQGRPKVLAGCEYYFTADAVELWEQGPAGPLTGLNDSTFLLMEFPANAVPEQAAAAIHELSITGVTPVLAHPERNSVLAREPEKLRRLVELGALAQVTAASVAGHLGSRIQQVTDLFLDEGLVHFIASDAHSVDRRPPCLDEARKRVEQKWGPEIAVTIFETNPAAVLPGTSAESWVGRDE
jgi:protein-tyrosine phosphatase